MQTKLTPSYGTHYETLIALVTHLAVKGEDQFDEARPKFLAKHMGLDEMEVTEVLDSYKGIFRRSRETYPSELGPQYHYTLQLRYAQRKYVDGKSSNVGEALQYEELFALLEFINAKVQGEMEDERHRKSGRLTMIGVWVAASFSLISAVLGLLK